ncbi:1-propanol dehydrogenase [Evansella caseinilytica]|uniref:1-propanol dehydrogenase n=1 Tax=Evansella caseinilytica TaxID=1503961 RepID=A0A1H3HX19_9BACI|nr:1-propanol dehydrogenase [Evansella caseinilytica]
MERVSRFSGKRIWFVCDPFLTDLPVISSLMAKLEKNNTLSVFQEVVPDPPVGKIIEGTAGFLRFKPNVIIAAGGGSAIDTAKAVLFFSRKASGHKIDQFLAIPTTSGTGSEVTSISVITDPEKKVKYPLADAALIPDEALLNAELVVSCPKSVTAYSGMDVLTHSLEALVATKATNCSDAFAEKSVQLVLANLLQCYEDGTNSEARASMHEASCMAGLAFENAGLGICHAISHQLGGHFHLPHGLVNAMLLPHVIAFNSGNATAGKKYAAVARMTGIAPMWCDDHAAVKYLIAEITNLADKLDCCRSLTAAGVLKEDSLAALKEIVENAEKDFTLTGNPIQPAKEEITALCLAII